MLKKLKTFLQKNLLQMCVQKDYDEVMEQLVRGIHTREIIYKEEGSEAFDLFILVSHGTAAYPLGKVFSIILSTNYRYNLSSKHSKTSNSCPEEICRWCKRRNKTSERLAQNLCLCPCDRGGWRKRDLEILQERERLERT